MKRFFSLIVVLLFVLALGAVFAETPAKVWVVSVGVGKYNQNDFNAIGYAPRGASKFAQAIIDAVPENAEAAVLSTDSAYNNYQPTGQNLAKLFNELGKKVAKSDFVLCYFIGHCIQESGVQRLLLSDSDLSNKELSDATTISLTQLKDYLERLPASSKLLILDVNCISPQKSENGNVVVPVTKEFLQTGSKWNLTDGQVAATFFACLTGQQVYYNKKRQSFFTEALVDGINGKALNKEGLVTLKSLSDYVRTRVPKDIAKELGSAKKQTPLVMPVSDVTVVIRPASTSIAVPVFTGTFANPTLLRNHFLKHGAEFGVSTEAEYLKAAQAFLSRPLTKTSYTGWRSDAKWGSSVGDFTRYDSATNEFAVVSKYGNIRTYFIAEGGLAYFKRNVDEVYTY